MVYLKLPADVRAGPLDPKKLVCRVMRVDGGRRSAPRYILRCNAGVLNNPLPGDDLTAAPLEAAKTLDFPETDLRYGLDSGVPRITLRAAAHSQHVGEPSVRCNCRKPCSTNSRCACVKAGRVCSRHCGCCSKGFSCDNFLHTEQPDSDDE